MNLVRTILILVSLGLNLGASAWERCAPDTEDCFVESSSHSNDHSEVLAEDHAVSNTAASSQSPCSHNACHFGHCVHVLLASSPAFALSIRGKNRFLQTAYQGLIAKESRPQDERPPRA